MTTTIDDDFPDDDAAFWADVTKREAQLRAVTKMADELWQNMVKLYGKDKAEQLWADVAGIKIAGRKPVQDALDRYIDILIGLMMHNRDIKKLKHGENKRLQQYIQESIKKRPLTELRVDEHGAELEQVVVLRHVEDEKLRMRIRAGSKRFEEKHGV